MTPAERARLIEKQEFEAEANALRKRALAYAEQCQRQYQERFGHLFDRPAATTKKEMPKPRGVQAKTYTAHGMTKTVSEWADYLNIHPQTLRLRLSKGFPFEQVFNTAPLPRGPKPKNARRPANA